MPCGGPDCVWAKEEGGRAYDAVMQLLNEKYNIEPKVWYMIWKGDKAKEQHTKVQLDLKTAIEEMFVHNACATW